ncbi:MAG: hypothetical protein AAFZ80_09895 [Cyanobacteria bacterium P01_A01_bin.105]
MARPTQAHITKTVPKRYPQARKDLTRKQTEYYMGAKLLEVGVNPNKAIYRWTIEDVGPNEKWTYSAYWDDMRQQVEAEEAAGKSIPSPEID